MSATLPYDRVGLVAVITLAQPPVNALSLALREELDHALQAAIGAADITAIVLTGAGKLFCAGADLRQFDQPQASSAPMVRAIIDRIESSPKPVLAALHGGAYGGGLELALACHYRLAAPGTRLALPEVRLGILPAAGGTQRLPRLVGVAAALGLILTGKPIEAAAALALGLVDAVPNEDLLAAALSMARQVVLDGGPHPIAMRREVDRAGAAEALAVARLEALRDQPDQPAILACIDCIEAALTMPARRAYAYERARYDELKAGPRASALRQQFLSAHS